MAKIYKFIFHMYGADTCSWSHTYEDVEIKATSEKAAVEAAKKWCMENSTMGGYDWYIDRYSPCTIYKYTRTCPKCGATNTAYDKFVMDICPTCANDLSHVKVSKKIYKNYKDW